VSGLRAAFTAALALLLACRTGETAPPAPPAAAANLESGIALYNQGKYAEAEGVFRSLSGADPSGWLAASLVKQKRFADAEPPARAALKASPSHERAVPALGEALVAQKRLDDAVAMMSAVIKVKADSAYAYFWRGQAYYGKKQPDKMVGDFETFLKLAPKAPEAPTIRQLLASLR